MFMQQPLLASIRRFKQDRSGAFAISFVMMSGFLLSMAAVWAGRFTLYY
jgi:tight adherence protein G